MPAPSHPSQAPLAAARRLRSELRSLFDLALRTLARRCTNGTALDTDAFDAQQPACHALALACAELTATGIVLGEGKTHDEGLGLRLVLTGAAEALHNAMERVDALMLELDIQPVELNQLRTGPDMWTLRQAGLSGAALCALADQLALDRGEIGRVDFDAHEEEARRQFQRLADEVIVPLATAIHREDRTVPEAILDPLRAMGAFGLSIPESLGGSAQPGGGNRLMIAVTEILSEASLGAAGSLITRPEILARALLEGGTREQQRHWLPAIAAGRPLCAIAITEPDHGSDVAGLTLRATPTSGGWLLNGTKTWCTLAGKAELLMVVARTDPDRTLGHRGLSLMLVEKPSHEGHAFEFRQDRGGRLSGRAIPTLGYRGMHSFDLSFEDVFVPDTHVVGGETGIGRGFYFTMAGMDSGRIQTAARALGVMRGALRAALRHTLDRRVFGRPLFEHTLTKAVIAKMAARFAACRQFTYAVGARMDNGGGRMEASLVKLFACRAAESITRDAMQLFGGSGYAEETPVGRHFIDARVLSIFEGAEEALALKVVARTLIEGACRP